MQTHIFTIIYDFQYHMKNYEGCKRERIYIATIVLVFHFYAQKYLNQTVSTKANKSGDLVEQLTR